MRKIINSVVIIIILVFIGSQILVESSSILKSVSFSFGIWKNNIFPSLFPFFVLSELLIHYGLVELLGELFKPLMNFVFKTKGHCAFIFIMSIISGIPANAKYVKELYLSGLIDENEGSKILMFTHFSNPLFILGTVSITFLNNKEVGLLILLCHYITNLFIGIMFRNYYKTLEKPSKVSLKTAILNMHEKRISSNKSFGSVLTNSLINSMNTLLLILGVVTFFLIITTIIDKNINLNNYYQSILNGFFEMTQGLKYISILDIPLKMKAVLCTMIISFGGLSSHMQVMSILSDTKIKYLPFLTARVIHALISSVLVYLICDIWIYIL